MSVSSLRRPSVRSINDVNLPSGLLKDMSVEFLQTLDKQDTGTFYEFFQELQLKDVKDARGDCQRQQETNRGLAVKNNDREPEFTTMKEELRRLVTEADELKNDYEQNYQEMKQFQAKSELSTLRKQLQEGVKSSENTSEDYATNFVAGKTSLAVDDFIEGLVAKRTEYWLRKVKLEKFDELGKNRRPVAAPRTAVSNQPASSLPVVSPGRQPDPTVSLPPYPTSGQGPFPSAAYPAYRPQYAQPYSHPQPQPASYIPSPPGPQAGFYRQPRPQAASYRPPGPRPQAYGGHYVNQHRY